RNRNDGDRAVAGLVLLVQPPLELSEGVGGESSLGTPIVEEQGPAVWHEYAYPTALEHTIKVIHEGDALKVQRVELWLRRELDGHQGSGDRTQQERTGHNQT